MSAHIEVVHTGPSQFHARLVYSNGEIGWTTETFKRRRAAYRAVNLLVGVFTDDPWPEPREVDERTTNVTAPQRPAANSDARKRTEAHTAENDAPVRLWERLLPVLNDAVGHGALTRDEAFAVLDSLGRPRVVPPGSSAS